MKMNIIFPLIVLFLNTSPALSTGMYDSSASVKIYLVKNFWHTGIVFKVDDIREFIPEIIQFKDYKYIDIGWGDEEFYQYPGFDAGLAVKAIFYPSPSAIRVEGFNIDIIQYIGFSDMAVMLELSKEQLVSIAEHISLTFFKQSNDSTYLLSSRYSGNIRFYKAVGEYHLFNTCNTWIARGMNNAGIEMKEHIILAEQLFREAAESGTVLKTMQTHEAE